MATAVVAPSELVLLKSDVLARIDLTTQILEAKVEGVKHELSEKVEGVKHELSANIAAVDVKIDRTKQELDARIEHIAGQLNGLRWLLFGVLAANAVILIRLFA